MLFFPNLTDSNFVEQHPTYSEWSQAIVMWRDTHCFPCSEELLLLSHLDVITVESTTLYGQSIVLYLPTVGSSKCLIRGIMSTVLCCTAELRYGTHAHDPLRLITVSDVSWEKENTIPDVSWGISDSTPPLVSRHNGTWRIFWKREICKNNTKVCMAAFHPQRG